MALVQVSNIPTSARYKNVFVYWTRYALINYTESSAGARQHSTDLF